MQTTSLPQPNLASPAATYRAASDIFPAVGANNPEKALLSGTSARGILARVVVGFARLFFDLILLAAVILFAFLAVGPHIAGYRTVTMLSGSMRHNINPGDVVVVTPEPLSQVAVGQILTFHTPTPTQYVDTHRVIEVRHGSNGAVLIRTKGDANAVADPWVAELHGSTAWQVRAVVPHLGQAIHEMRAPAIHMIFQWACMVLLVVLVLGSIWTPTKSHVASAA